MGSFAAILATFVVASPPQSNLPPRPVPESNLPALGYTVALEIAAATGKPLVCGVKCKAPRGPWVSCQWDECPWKKDKPFLCISKGNKGSMYYVCDLPASASIQDVLEAIKRPIPGLNPPAAPALPRPGSVRNAVDFQRRARTIVECKD